MACGFPYRRAATNAQLAAWSSSMKYLWRSSNSIVSAVTGAVYDRSRHAQGGLWLSRARARTPAHHTPGNTSPRWSARHVRYSERNATQPRASSSLSSRTPRRSASPASRPSLDTRVLDMQIHDPRARRTGVRRTIELEPRRDHGLHDLDPGEAAPASGENLAASNPPPP